MKGEPVQTTYSAPSKIPNIGGVTNICSYHRFWAYLNVTRFSNEISSDYGNIPKLFGFQLLDSLIPCGTRNLKKHNTLPLKCLFLTIILTLLYRLNTGTLIEAGNSDSVGLIKYSTGRSVARRKIVGESSIDPSYLSERVLPTHNTVDSSIPEWWKDWIVRDILPSWRIPSELVDKVTVLLRTKSTENLKNFFEFYIDGIPNGKDATWGYDSDPCSIRTERQNLRRHRSLEGQKKILENNLFSSAMIGFCEKLLFEAEDLFNDQGSESNTDSIETYPYQLWLHLRRYHNTDLPYQPIVSYTRYITNSWVKHEYRERCWNLIQDFVGFYNWAYYSKNNWVWQGYKEELDIGRYIARQGFSEFGNSEHSVTVQSFLSEILYNLSIHLLLRVKTSESLESSYAGGMESIDPRIKNDGMYGGYSVGRTPKDEDEEFSSPIDFPSSNTRSYSWGSNHYGGSSIREWDWKQFLIPTKLPTSIEYLNSGLYLFHTLPSTEGRKEFMGKGGIVKSLAETLFPMDRGVSKSGDSEPFVPEIMKPFTDYNHSDTSSMYEQFSLDGSGKQSFKKQQYIPPKDSKLSEIDRVIDPYRIKRYSYYPSPKFYKSIGDGFLPVKGVKGNNLFVHKLLLANITHPFRSVFEKIGTIFSSRNSLQFKELLATGTERIISFITVSNYAPNEIITNSICESNQAVPSGYSGIISSSLGIGGMESSKKEILLNPAKHHSGVNTATGWDSKIRKFTLWYTVRDDILTLWNNLGIKNNISSIYRLIRVCKHDGLVSLYSIHTTHVRKYLYSITVESISKSKHWIDPWVGNGDCDYLAKYAIHRNHSIWRNNLDNQFDEFIIRTDQFHSDVREIINRIRNLERFPKLVPYQREYAGIVYNSNRLINNPLLWWKMLEKHYFHEFLIADRAFEKIVETFKPFVTNSVSTVNRFMSLIGILSGELSCYKINPLKDPKSRSDDGLMVPFDHYAILANNAAFKFLHNENIFTESSYNSISTRIDNWNDQFNQFNIWNNIPLKYSFNEANTLSFLDYFHNPQFDCGGGLSFIKGIIPIRDYNQAYIGIISNDTSKGSNKFFSLTRMKTFLKNSNISRAESRSSNRILPGIPDPIPRKTENSSYEPYPAKEFIQLTRAESRYYGETNMFPFRGIFMNCFPVMKRLVNVGISDYWQPFLEPNQDKFLTMVNSSSRDQFQQNEPGNGTISPRCNRNDSDNSRMIGSGKHRNSNKKLFNLVIGREESICPSLPINCNELWGGINPHQRIKKDFSLTGWIPIEKYTLWFFTPEWWKYVNNSLLEAFSETLSNINDQLRSNVPDTFGGIDKSFINSWSNFWNRVKAYLLNNPIPKFDSFPSGSLIRRERYSLSKWLLLGFINDHSFPYLMLIIVFINVHGISQQYSATLVGLNSISLWNRSEIIKYLMDFPQMINTERLIYSLPPVGQNLARNSLVNYSRRLLNHLIHVSFYYPLRRGINTLLSRKKNLDLSREDKNLVVQYLTTSKTLSRYRFHLNHSFDLLSDKINGSVGKQGFNHLQYLTNTCQKNLLNYQTRQYDPVENLILSAFRHDSDPPKIFTRSSSPVNMPIPLQLGSFPSRGILLVGPIETGRSYLVKNLAANSRFPSVRIPINKFLYSKPDFRNTPVTLILKKCLQRLNFTFELAKRMSPCMVWIQDIHELSLDYAINELEVDPKFLLHSLLVQPSSKGLNYCLEKDIVIASTHAPARVDPAITSPDRLDQLINIRMLDTHQRGKEFTALLHAKGFHLGIDPFRFEELKSGTMGYSKRDLAVLANETLLVSITRKNPFVCTDTIKFASYKQGWALDNRSQSVPGYEMLLYRVGKVIIRNSFTNISYTDFSFVNNSLLKKRFYFLSNWYLEPPIAESTLKELTLLPYILGCLAGTAARDSWFVLENEQEENVFINRIVENDLQLACGISESLLVEFTRLVMCRNELNKSALQFSTRSCLDTIQKRIHPRFSGHDRVSDERLGNENRLPLPANGPFSEFSCNLSRTPRVWRINFLRGSTHGLVRVPSEPDPSYNFMILHQNQDHPTRGCSGFNRIGRVQNVISERREKFVGYRRILENTREKHTQTQESQLVNLLLRERFTKLGSDESSIQYETQHDLSNQSITFRGGRFIWDPTSLSFFETDNVSPRDKLFSGEETVRRLYVTYSIRRGGGIHSSSNKYKKHLLYCGYNRDSITESFADPWNESTPADKRHFECVKINQMVKSHLLTPQLLPVVYPYQNIFIENARNRYDHFKFSNHRHRWIEINRSLPRDSIIYTMLFESYQYLLNFFLSNRIVLSGMTNVLSKKESILPSDTECLFSNPGGAQ